MADLDGAKAFTLDDVRAAAAALAEHVDETPVWKWRDGAPAGSNLTLKLELFQRAGSFKARGAVYALLGLDAAARRRGVTAVSAGNHAIAVAYAAARLGASAKVVMPKSAPAFRVARAQALGAEVVFASDAAEAFVISEGLARDEGRAFLHPYDGVRVNTGAGTLGLELHAQAPDLDAVIVAVGGGGLAGGVAHTLKALQPDIEIFGVEPEGADNLTRSLAEGAPAAPRKPATIADSLGPPACAPYSFALCQANLAQVVTVTDEEIRKSMIQLFQDAKLAVEPAAAAALAAWQGPLHSRLRTRNVGLIICGSNIDPVAFGRALLG